jgi:UDP-glucose 4-epimerase
VLPVDESHPISPTHPYFASKYCGELLCEHVRETTDINVSSLRITSPYGPGMKPGTVLPLFVDKALKAPPITVHGQGSRTQNFVYGPDVAKAAIALLGTSGGICNVAGPEAISMLELAEIISRLAPGRPAVTLAGTPDPLEEQRWEVSAAKLEKLTGYAPRTRPEEGIRHYMNWLSAPSDDSWWSEQ